MLCLDCNIEMVVVTVYDEGSSVSYAYNLHQCNSCGLLCQENVWTNPSKVWLSKEGETR